MSWSEPEWTADGRPSGRLPESGQRNTRRPDSLDLRIAAGVVRQPGPDSGRRRFFRVAVVLAASLTGCGFQPLYSRRSVGEVDDVLAQVKIQSIEGRVGQQVHNYLLDRLNRTGRPADPAYLLEIVLRVSKVELGIERDETATRAKLVLTADLTLADIETKDILLRRSARTANSYNIVDSALATRSAELDAIDRAAREVSDEIRILLSLYFRRKGGNERQ